MEEVLGVAPSGTYDSDYLTVEVTDNRARRVRRLAVKVVMLKYSLLLREASRCQCGRCGDGPSMKLETEP